MRTAAPPQNWLGAVRPCVDEHHDANRQSMLKERPMLPGQSTGMCSDIAMQPMSEAKPPQRTATRLLRDVLLTQFGNRPQGLIPTGMNPIGLARQSEATSVCPGQRPVLWAWLDLNQRPHPYQAYSPDAFMLEKRGTASSAVGWQ
jgi:hypothetical protein